MEEAKQPRDEQPTGTQEQRWTPLSKEARQQVIREFKKSQQAEAEYNKRKEVERPQKPLISSTEPTEPPKKEPTPLTDQERADRIGRASVEAMNKLPKDFEVPY